MLPPLRQDLSLHPGPQADDGSPTWMLHDPAANRFYALSWSAFEILARWSLREPAAVLAAVNRQTTLEVDEEDLEAVVHFLQHHHLLDAQTAADNARLFKAVTDAKLSPLQWLLQNYLFVRVPLVRPAGWLKRWAPRIAWVFEPGFWVCIAASAIIGLCLASRQWDSFIGTFAQYKSWSGVVAIGCALSLAKVLHELGHAFTAQRHGCRVSTMGVAFLVMLPVLYTDTNEAWKLPGKRQRLQIAAAGMLAELALAAIATLVWNFLPDGPIRAGVFLLATTTWILTLAINASPFMRFDGYFLLCDWLDVANLHSRAFALGRWRLRGWIFGWADEPPEQFTESKRRFLVGFAFATWLYRLGVFLGIAYLVYDAVFKLLGILLLAIELGWFIALPIGREIAAWWTRRSEMTWNPATRRSACIAAAALAVLLVPVGRDVRAPGILGAAHSQELYAVAAARVMSVAVPHDTLVSTGQVLLRLESPELTDKLGIATSKEQQLRRQLDLQPLNAKLLDQGAALREQWAGAVAEMNGLKAQIDELTIRAPFDGRVVDVNEGLAPGAWVAPQEKLLHVIGLSGAKGEILVDENELGRLVGRTAVFVAERAEQKKISCSLGAVDRINLSALDTPYLASTYGGAVRVQQDATGALVPVETVFRARLTDCATGASPRQEMRGTAHLVGTSTSIAGTWLRRATIAIQRELGR